MKGSLSNAIPAAAFAGGIGLLCYGLTLVYYPAGFVGGGIALAVGAFAHERAASRRR